VVGLAGSFRDLEPKKIMVIGDLMLDSYTLGTISRISPEAPVPILRVKEEEKKAGGAGNVMLNLKALEADVIAVGRVGDDASGEFLVKELGKQGINTSFIIREKTFQTPLKNRIIASNQQLMRVDFEEVKEMSSESRDRLLSMVEEQIDHVDLIAISDYGKGLLTESFLQGVIALANKKEKMVVVDPKGRDFSKYRGADIIKPNTKEALLASGLESTSSLESIAKELLEKVQCKYLLVTRSQDGMTYFNQKLEREDIPVTAKEVNDVTGAGDTVLAMLSYTLANQFPIDKAVSLANVAAGIAIEHFGCVSIRIPELAQRMLDLDINNKVFELGHLFALKSALSQQSYALLIIEGSDSITKSLFQSICQLRMKQRLVLYLKGQVDSVFVKMLASLKEIDFIVTQSSSFEDVEKELDPQSSWVFDKEKLKEINLSKD
jgi:D-glycero-beta-D-manno-heptose-7-phosphate kinase